jgi:Short repeat of unknown function (DUF308)
MNTRSRAWLITGGILSLVVGFLALGSPILFSFLIVRLLAVFALVDGVISLLVTIFGKDVATRGLNAVFALVRIVAGFIKALKSGHVGGVALDVYEEEEGVFPNVLVTAHQAFFTREALSEIARVTVENIRRFASKEALFEGTVL